MRRALDSVLAQDFAGEWEVVVGDDASTDSTRAICEEYARRYPERIRLMPKAANKGLVGNYFDCMLACQGEYVTDCAGDDYWISPHKLRDMAHALDAHPEATVACSDYEIVDAATGRRTLASENPRNILRPGLRISPSELLRRALGPIDTLPYSLSASMYRKSALMRVYKKYPGMVCNPEFGCEDLPVEAALASQGGAVYLPEPTIAYVVDSSSVSNGGDEGKQVRFYAKSMHCSAVLARHYGVRAEELAEMYRHKSDYVVSLAFNSGNPELAHVARRAVEEWPLAPSRKVRLQLWLTGHPGLWRVARLIKLSFKRVLT